MVWWDNPLHFPLSNYDICCALPERRTKTMGELKHFIAGKDVVALLTTGLFTAYTISGKLHQTEALHTSRLYISD